MKTNIYSTEYIQANKDYNSASALFNRLVMLYRDNKLPENQFREAQTAFNYAQLAFNKAHEIEVQRIKAFNPNFKDY